ncbi:MAG: preprotein translocase subunit SecA [Spirochaetia bacterium]|nr:preprotein translocase subunit SecA [Spirochaetia bacterium]
MLQKVVEAIFGSKHDRDLKALLPILHKVNEKESWAMGLKDDQFKEVTRSFRERLKAGETLDDILPEAFALCREASRRVLGERPYDVQIMGGIVLHQGKITEMKTGEGKTLASVTAAYLNALSGKGVHIVTVNDYLAERDAQWMGKVHNFLGITVGTVLSNMDFEAKRKAYNCDITYATNNELGFDYLRDNMRWSDDQKVQRGHNFAIVDEIDSILIDEARTPLIISGAAEDDTSKFYQVDKLIHYLDECKKNPETGEYPEEDKDLVGDYKLEEKTKHVVFTNDGMNKIESLLLKNKYIEGSLFTDDNFEYIHYFTQALKAHKLFHRDVDYVVQAGEVQIVDEFTGRILTGRRYSDGLHQAIEAKEKIKVARKNRTHATITFQNYFRMYDKLSGMTGTADTEAREFTKIYDLDVVVLPTNRPVIRDDMDDEIYLNEEYKFKAICDEISAAHAKGQPVLVGTVSIEKSEQLSSLLTKRGIRHEVLNAKNHAREAMIISEAGAKGSVTIATNMAGRGTDIKLGGNPEFMARKMCGTEAEPEEYEKALAKATEKWKADYEEVKSLGGLYVIGTERHESRRIDNQLRGRSGRQGDPGKSKFYISLDDTLMRLFGGDNLKSMMARIGMKGDEPIHHPWISKSIENAQKRVEERNYEIRKHLLDYDNVLSEHRKYIYSKREEVLADKDFIGHIKNIIAEFADDLFEGIKEMSEVPEIIRRFRETLYYTPDAHIDVTKPKTLPDLKQAILDNIYGEMDDKASKVGVENFNMFARMEYLRLIDIKWQEHLENLDALREAVNLRAYGQKNPLLEYKLEGFEIFDKMIDDIRKVIVRKVINVKVERYSEQPRQVQATSVATHQESSQFDSHRNMASQSGAVTSNPTGNIQVVRSTPKVGRNDPCPCGSGKKYKHCHGA